MHLGVSGCITNTGRLPLLLRVTSKPLVCPGHSVSPRRQIT